MVSRESRQLVDYELVHSMFRTFLSRIQKEEGVEEVRAHIAGYNIMARDIVATTILTLSSIHLECL